MTDLQQWLERLEQLHPTEIELGLDRISEVAINLALATSSGAKVITVAGTNGKGSCVATLEGLLIATGHKVGAYTSPHFLVFNERFRVDGVPVEDKLIVDAFEVIEAARGDISLTYFEYTTLAGLLIFEQSEVDVVILEVGLGGRLDAVNLVDADIAIVTSIALDHQDYLGDDIDVIGFEKAGVFRPNKVAIAGVGCPDSVFEHARNIGALWMCSEEHFSYQPGKSTWSGRRPDHSELTLTGVGSCELPQESVSCAIQAIVSLGVEIDSALLSRVLPALNLPGRYQRTIYQQVPLILDVAHNPAAAIYLAERLRSENTGPIIAVTAMMADKDISGVFEPLMPVIEHWFFAGLVNNSRAAKPEVLVDCLNDVAWPNRAPSVVSSETVTKALSAAVELAGKNNGLIIVFGSFFTVAEVMALL